MPGAPRDRHQGSERVWAARGSHFRREIDGAWTDGCRCIASVQISSFRDLKVWQNAFALAERSCAIADSLRRSRRSGLATQIERAAASIPANIAEGNGRSHRGDYLHHLSIASGSLAELESHLLLAQALAGVDRERVSRALALAREVGRMLGGLMRALQNSPHDRR